MNRGRSTKVGILKAIGDGRSMVHGPRSHRSGLQLRMNAAVGGHQGLLPVLAVVRLEDVDGIGVHPVEVNPVEGLLS